MSHRPADPERVPPLLSAALLAAAAWAGCCLAAWHLLELGAAELVRLAAALAVVVALACAAGAWVALRHFRRAQAAAAGEQDRRNRLIVDAAADAILTFDHEGRIESFNAAAARLFGYSAEEIIGRDISLLIGTEDDRGFDAAVRQALGTGSARVLVGDVRFFGRHKDGRTIPIELGVSKVLDEDRRVYVQIIRDLTDRRQAEDELRRAKETAEAASKAKSEFLANVSHEIRTPLNGILGLTDLLLSGALTPQQRDHLGLVQASGETLLTLIDDLLDFAKIEAARMVLEETPFTVRPALETTLKTLAVRATLKRLRFTWEISDELPPVLVGDPLRLQQVLLNLVGNAIKFTSEGEVVVRLLVDSKSDDVVVLHGVVSDTGIGVLPEKRELIFEAFRQADASRSRKYGGTGLGLTIASRLVGLMGGRIWLESEPGQGSTFHFTARVRIASKDQVPSDHARLRPSPAGEGQALPEAAPVSRRVLVAEDNPVNAELLDLILRKREHRVTFVTTGPEAVAACGSDVFDVVLMDLQLPELDGLEATKQILARAGRDGKGPAVFGLTAHATEEDRQRCLEAGMKAYLGKPVHPLELLRLIDESAP